MLPAEGARLVHRPPVRPFRNSVPLSPSPSRNRRSIVPEGRLGRRVAEQAMNDRQAQDDRDVREAACTQLLREWVGAREPVWLPLNGRSMAPFLPGGSKILVCKTAVGQIGWGDLLVYEVEGRLVCHRVLGCQVQCGRPLFLMQGDGHWTNESWVGEAQVLGKVSRVERQGRLVDLNTRIRRLQAVSLAVYSLVGLGLRTLGSWGKQYWTCRRASARIS